MSALILGKKRRPAQHGKKEGARRNMINTDRWGTKESTLTKTKKLWARKTRSAPKKPRAGAREKRSNAKDEMTKEVRIEGGSRIRTTKKRLQDVFVIQGRGKIN